MKLLRGLAGVFTALLAAALGLAIFSTAFLGLTFTIVLTGSMSPIMPAGSLAVVSEVDPARVALGDVITFDFPPDDPKIMVTHRVVEVTEMEGGGLAFRTKGDANEEEDSSLVPARNVRGQVLLAIPYVGYTRDLLRSFAGLVLFVVLPGALLVGNELFTQLRESNPRHKALRHRRRRA
jgi:signal peptidase